MARHYTKFFPAGISQNHWIWALPPLMAVALLGLSQVDLYPPRTDEFYSMFNVGWIVDGPYSPLDTLASLRRVSPDHSPLFFILLNLWGQLTAPDVALGRVLTVFSGLLAAAMVYRLSRDQVAPAAGLIALIIMASNAVFNFYLWYLRMYPLLLLTSVTLLWMYLRLADPARKPKRRDYSALFLAAYALANTHAISALLFIALGLYHLLHKQKDRRWLETALVIGAALALFLPWAAPMLTEGLGQTFSRSPPSGENTAAVLFSWLNIMFVGSALMLTLTLLLAALPLPRAVKRLSPAPLLLLYYLLALALFTHFVGIVVPGTMRLTTPGFALFLLLAARIHYRAWRWKPWLALLLTLWLVAGIVWQHSGQWTQYLSISGRYTERIPWHAVSRVLERAEQPGTLLGYKFDDFRVNWRSKLDYPQRDYYFTRLGVSIEALEDSAALAASVNMRALREPHFWLMYRRGLVPAVEAAALADIISSARYQACDTYKLGIDTVLTFYRWQGLGCQAPEVLSAHETGLLRYAFYGAVPAASGDAILLLDSWEALADFDPWRFSLSHQLLSAEGLNVASLDLALAQRQGLGQYSIDISAVAPGTYTLVAILYDNHSGERLNWRDNPAAASAMLPLTEIHIPAA